MPLDPLAILYVHMQYANFGHNTAKELPMTSMSPLGNTVLYRES